MMLRYLATTMLLVAACGDDGGSTPPKVDAPATVDGPVVLIDAPPGTVDMPAATNVETIACATGEPVVMATTGMYVPAATTIATGGVVKFVMPATHNVVPNTGTDTNVRVNFNETKCLKFNVAGTYSFRCGPHNFMGSITVN